MSSSAIQGWQRHPTHASSEVPHGYQRMETGVIPEDWDPRPLSYAVAKLLAGISVNSVIDDSAADSGEPRILKTSCVQSGAFLAHEAKTIAPKDRQRAKLNPRGDSILISRMNTIDLVGECGFVERDDLDLFIPDRLWMAKFHVGSSVSARWLSYVLSSAGYKKQLQSIATGTSGSMKNIAKGALLGLPIAFPPPAEQRVIAGALSDVDELLGALKALIAKKRAIKQACVQQLLTGETRLPGFSEPWGRFPLKKFVRDFIVPMRDKPKRLTEGMIPWCRIEDLDGIYLSGSKSEQYVDREAIQEMNLRVYPIGTLLVSCSADLGRCTIVARPLVSNQTFIGLVIDDSVGSNLFFYHFMTFRAAELNDLSSGTTISYLSRKQFEDFRVSVPSNPEEQQAIAIVLSDMDAEIAALEWRWSKTRAIKQGMMQQLLTGRVRLVKPAQALVSA